jgi:hypothetical protein
MLFQLAQQWWRLVAGSDGPKENSARGQPVQLQLPEPLQHRVQEMHMGSHCP